MSDKLPPLPPGWTAHQSSNNPGHTYFFNKYTGDRTWDRDQLVVMGGSNKVAKEMVADVSNLKIKELENLLKEKKRNIEEAKKARGKKRELPRDEEAQVQEKRKMESVEPSFKKRQKIVFDLKKKDELVLKGKEGRRKESPRKGDRSSRRERENNNSIDKDDDANQVKDSKPSLPLKLNQSKDKVVNSSTDSSLYGMDEDELQQLKTIKSKYSSPPKTPKQKSVSLPTQEDLNTSNPSPLATTISKYLPENYGFQYVNYQADPKQTYQREYKPRERPVLKKLEGQFSSKPLASSEVREQVVDLDRTPEQNLDVTPVFGSLEDSLEWGLGGGVVAQGRGLADMGQVTEVEPGEDVGEAEVVTERREDSWGETSWEGERPGTPPLVQEMQEEESMEWESIDREEVLKETHRVRALLSEVMEVEETEMVQEEIENEEKVKVQDMVGKKPLVVVDTNVFISSLGIVSHLRDDMTVLVVIPWMVVQELDNLKTSTSRDTAVRARASVRWMNTCLQTQHRGVIMQTVEQNRRAANMFESKNADDRILACCLMLKEEGNKVTLLTNDMNLANKGMINQVKCGDAENIVSVLSDSEEVRVEQQEEEGPDEKKVCSELIMQGENTTRDLLEVVLKKEFLLAYGEKLWEKIVSIKPKPSRPHWSLNNLFTMFSKHHLAVFGIAFPRNGHELKLRLQTVKDKLRTRVWRVKEVKVVLAEMNGLFEVIKERDNYEGIMDICNDKLADISSQLDSYETVAAGNKKKKILVEDVNDGQETVQELFQNVWEIIACFTRGFANSMSVSNSLPNLSDMKFQSLADATRNLPTFFSTVSTLQEAMLQVLATNGSRTQLLEFHTLLTQFRANLELDQSFWPAFDKPVSLTQLEMFMTKQQNQVVVRGGLDQISEFRQILIRCISGGDGQML